MSNSPLVDYTRLSPNSTRPRNKAITKITIHHMAGNLTVENCAAVFASSSRQASSNYGIGTDGRVGLYVDEKNRSWASSSAANDHQAVTIEVANSQTGGNWPVSDAAYNKLIDLCTDICKRNGMGSLRYTGDAAGSLTIHKMFAATACPGPYLESRMGDIADKVNKKLSSAEPPDENGCPYGSSRMTLRRGSMGTAVKRCQWYLIELGYRPGIYGIDGDYGAETEATVKQFQIDSWMGADGVCGEKTWLALEAGLKNKKEEDDVTEERVREIIREELSGKGAAPSAWAKVELDEAKAKGITDGTNPQAYATREQTAIMVLRSMTAETSE